MFSLDSHSNHSHLSFHSHLFVIDSSINLPSNDDSCASVSSQDTSDPIQMREWGVRVKMRVSQTRVNTRV